MLKINKDYKCPPEEQLEQEWIDWGNLLVDDGINNDVMIHLDEDGNIVLGDVKISMSSLATDDVELSSINNYLVDNFVTDTTCYVKD